MCTRGILPDNSARLTDIEQGYSCLGFRSLVLPTKKYKNLCIHFKTISKTFSNSSLQTISTIKTALTFV